MPRKYPTHDSDLEVVHYAIEMVIAEEDARARAAGVTLTDSPVISVLTKVIKAAEGRPPKAPFGDGPRDGFLKAIYERLVAEQSRVRFQFEDEAGQTREEPIDTTSWVACLKRIADSARLRKGQIAGSRGYLDFLVEWLAELGHGLTN
jgi:hypothetical protein